MRISVIIPVWNRRDLLLRLLQTLDAQSERPGELLVIDNGSSDGAPELARQRGARIIAMGRNAGFAGAVNRGIRESRGELIAVLNSDVELAPDYLATLAATGAPFATGKILAAGTQDRIDGTYDAVCRGGTAWRVGQGRADGPIFSSRRVISSAPWTAALFRADVFQSVGFLHEAFESYLEDVEFGLRCAARGISGLYVPEAVAWHQGSATLGRWHPDTVRRIARNQCYLVAIHYPAPVLLRNLWPILVAQGLWGLVALRHGAGWGWLCGKLEGVRRFAELRRTQTGDEPHLTHQWLCANQSMIAETQKATGFDAYWRLYFLLTRGVFSAARTK